MRLVGRDAVFGVNPTLPAGWSRESTVGLVSFEDFLHADVCRMVRHGGRIFAEWLMKLKRWAARDLQEDPGVAFAGTCGRHGTAHPVVHD